MEKINKLLCLVPAIFLVSCNMSKEDAISSIIDGQGGGGNNNPGFTLSLAESGHSAVAELSQQEGGVSITFTATSYVDSDKMAEAVVKLSRVDNVEWATVNAFYMDGETKVEQSVGGLIKFNEDQSISTYYMDIENDSTDYVYFGDIYDENVKVLAKTFTFELLETYLTLDNAYLAGAIALGLQGTIGEVIAGQQCMSFTLNANNSQGLIPEFTGNDSLTFSFGLTSRLLMRVHHTHYGLDEENLPVVYQENVDVSGFSAAGEIPNMVDPA